MKNILKKVLGLATVISFVTVLARLEAGNWFEALLISLGLLIFVVVVVLLFVFVEWCFNE